MAQAAVGFQRPLLSSARNRDYMIGADKRCRRAKARERRRIGLPVAVSLKVFYGPRADKFRLLNTCTNGVKVLLGHIVSRDEKTRLDTSHKGGSSLLLGCSIVDIGWPIYKRMFTAIKHASRVMCFALLDGRYRHQKMKAMLALVREDHEQVHSLRAGGN